METKGLSADPRGPAPNDLVNWSGAQLSGDDALHYAVKGRPAFAFVDVYLKPGQEILADFGAMLWMEGKVPVSTACTGGCCAGFWRSCAGEGCCQNTFKGPGNVTFGFKLPGDMFPFTLMPGKGWLIKSGAFVAGSRNIVVDAKFMGCMFCCCSGEGAFLTYLTVKSGNGMFFAGKYGGLEFHDVPDGKEFIVDPGLFFAVDEDALSKKKISIGMAAGCQTCICGQQGIVIKFKGPCRVVTNTRDPYIFVDLLENRRSQENKGGQGGNVKTGNEQADQVARTCKLFWWVYRKIKKCIRGRRY